MSTLVYHALPTLIIVFPCSFAGLAFYGRRLTLLVYMLLRLHVTAIVRSFHLLDKARERSSPCKTKSVSQAVGSHCPFEQVETLESLQPVFIPP